MKTYLKTATKVVSKSPQSKLQTSLQIISKQINHHQLQQIKQSSKAINRKFDLEKKTSHTLGKINTFVPENTIQSFKIPKIKSSKFPRIKKKYGALRLINRLRYKVPYRYRWGKGSWKSRTLSPDTSRYHAWKYRSSKPRSPNFQIKFDADPKRDQNDTRKYFLKRAKSSGKPHKNAHKYQFVKVATGEINLIPSFKVQTGRVSRIRHQNKITGSKRTLSFITMKRKHIKLNGEDKYGHWWTEIDGKGKEKESYGWWPKTPVGLWDTLRGIDGELNGETSFGGSRTEDPHHGDSAPDTFNPVIKTSKSNAAIKKEIRAFAKNYKGEWRWTFGFGQNCHTFQESLMNKVGLKET